MNELGKYIDPFTDFGFKRLFGSEPNKDLLIDFLNELLRGKKKKDRSLFYATFPIQEQSQKGSNWNYRLSEVYTVGIMDFAFDDSHPEQFRHEVKLMETQRKEVFYDKLTFIYLEMVKFNKTEEELVTHFDKWLFLLKNLHRFQEIPAVLQEKVFRKAFKIAEVAKLNQRDMEQYQASLKYKRDWKNTIDYAVEEAAKKAAKKAAEEATEIATKIATEVATKVATKESMRKVAKSMKDRGYALSEIAELTGLSVTEIEKL